MFLKHIFFLHFKFTDGISSSIKGLERFLDNVQIKSVTYNMILLYDFLNNSADKNKLNIQNFIKSLIIELSDAMSNEIYVQSGESNIDKVTSEKMEYD